MSEQSENGRGKMPQSASPFNPIEHLIQIKGRNGSSDYLPVQWRLVWFRSIYPNGSIETEMLHLDLDRDRMAALGLTRRRLKTRCLAPTVCDRYHRSMHPITNIR